MWDINFSWGQYNDVFKTIKPFWQSITTIKNYRFICDKVI